MNLWTKLKQRLTRRTCRVCKTKQRRGDLLVGWICRQCFLNTTGASATGVLDVDRRRLAWAIEHRLGK